MIDIIYNKKDIVDFEVNLIDYIGKVLIYMKVFFFIFSFIFLFYYKKSIIFEWKPRKNRRCRRNFISRKDLNS